ncbi:MAG: thiamine pyrophosphate-dependent enzyme [Oscillospiraceae bacterium]
MTANAGSGHPGGSLSAVELMTSVFHNHMRLDPKNPKWEDRDRFVLSKGHSGSLLLCGPRAVWASSSRSEYANFRQLHSILQGHPDCKKVPGVDASTGSLGQGCSIAVGMALGAKKLGKDTQVFTLLGDGECQEGQIWEAFMSAAHYQPGQSDCHYRQQRPADRWHQRRGHVFGRSARQAAGLRLRPV